MILHIHNLPQGVDKMNRERHGKDRLQSIQQNKDPFIVIITNL